MAKPQNIVIVGGCGHVGLPLGIVLASHGFQVTLLDIDVAKVATVNSGIMPFRENGAEPVLRKVCGKSLTATTDEGCLKSAGIVITVVGTPVDRHLNPTVHDLYKSLRPHPAVHSERHAAGAALDRQPGRHQASLSPHSIPGPRH